MSYQAKTDWKYDDMVTEKDMNRIEQGIQEAYEEISNIPGATGLYGETTNTGNKYAVTVTPAPAAYAPGLRVTVKINTTNNGAATLDVNGLGAKTIKKSNGNDVASGNLKANSVYTLVYDGVGAFILQGEGGEYGTATASKVLAGTTFGTENGVALGSAAPKVVNMLDNGSFESGLEAWTARGKGITTGEQPGIAKIGTKYIQFMSQQDGIAADIIQTVPVIKGHKYYASAWCRTTGFSGIHDGSGQIDIIGLPDGTEIDFIVLDKGTVPQDDNWHFLSGIAEGTETGDFTFRAYTHNMSVSFLDGVMLIDLTSMFGAGNEPDNATMDAIVQANGGFWDTGLEFVKGKGLGVDPGKILSGFKFIGSDGYAMTGTMPDFSSYPQQGKHAFMKSARGDYGGQLAVEPLETAVYGPGLTDSGFGVLLGYDAQYIPENIRHDKAIFGVQGTYKPYPDITAGNERIIDSLGLYSSYSSTYAPVLGFNIHVPGTYSVGSRLRAADPQGAAYARIRYVTSKGAEYIIASDIKAIGQTDVSFGHDVTVNDDLGTIFIDLRAFGSPAYTQFPYLSTAKKANDYLASITYY